MKSFSQNLKLFSWSAPPMVTAVISLCVSACSVDESGSKSSLIPPDVSKSVAPADGADDEQEQADSDQKDAASAQDESSGADDREVESDESVRAEAGAHCRTVDDCAPGLVCVGKNDESVCEKGVMAERGPLNQPPPPVGLLDGGLKAARSEDQ